MNFLGVAFRVWVLVVVGLRTHDLGFVEGLGFRV